jgi:hypothetical protein
VQSPLAFLAYEQTKHANWALQPRDGWWTPNEPQKSDKAALAGKLSWKATLARLFLHGTAFSGLLMVAEIVWIVLTAFLILVGFIIGFILGIVVLLFIIGGLNSFLTEHIWHVSIKRGWKSVLGGLNPVDNTGNRKNTLTRHKPGYPKPGYYHSVFHRLLLHRRITR